MSRINVLHVSDKLTIGAAELHGVTRLFSWWIPRFDAARFSVSAASLRGPDDAGRHLEHLGIRVAYLERGRFDPRTVVDLLGLIRKEKLHVLHAHGYGATDFGRLCSILTRVPCIVHEHMVDPSVPRYQRLADRALARQTARAIAVSAPVRDFLARARAVPVDRIEVVPNGIPLDAFAAPSEADRAAFRAEAGIPGSHRLVGVIGRLHPIKGQRYFLEAAAQIAPEFGDVTFVVVGGGEDRTSLEQHAAALRIADRVRFLGHRDDVPRALGAIEVTVIPSLGDGGPLVLYEAMAAGSAVIVTEACGLADSVVDGETGFRVPARSAEAIAARLRQLLARPGSIREMGRRARARSADFGLGRTVERLEAIYEDLAGRP